MAINIKAEEIASTAEAELEKSKKKLHDAISSRQAEGPNTTSNSHRTSGHLKKSPGLTAFPAPPTDARGGRGLRGFAMSVCSQIEQVGGSQHTWNPWITWSSSLRPDFSDGIMDHIKLLHMARFQRWRYASHGAPPYGLTPAMARLHTWHTLTCTPCHALCPEGAHNLQ